ncbi:lantibiotic dehydratase C-terminal domain-containing protein [Nannocystis pusilla]|uniref:lantibiotic dehydratase C-terminal domain-containing protein n=1 Tax=Nannocystis pusilla TaxID=889268 RepID=UPI003B81371D
MSDAGRTEQVVPHVVGATTQRTWEHGWSSLRIAGCRAALEGAALHVVPRLLGESGAGRWCFIRTSDAAGEALEIFREGVAAEELTAKLTELAASLAPALADGRLSRLSVCRDGPPPFHAGAMGGNTTELMADLFHHDSVAALHLLRAAPADGSGGRPTRHRLAIHSLTRLLASLGLDGPTRIRVAQAALAMEAADRDAVRCDTDPGGEAGLGDADELAGLAEITAALDRRARALRRRGGARPDRADHRSRAGGHASRGLLPRPAPRRRGLSGPCGDERPTWHERWRARRERS